MSYSPNGTMALCSLSAENAWLLLMAKSGNERFRFFRKYSQRLSDKPQCLVSLAVVIANLNAQSGWRARSFQVAPKWRLQVQSVFLATRPGAGLWGLNRAFRTKSSREIKGLFTNGNTAVRILPPQPASPVSAFHSAEGANKPANARLFASRAVSGITKFEPIFRISGTRLWRTLRKFPFCGVAKQRFGSIRLRDRDGSRGSQNCLAENKCSRIHKSAFDPMRTCITQER